jgi:predicted transcriptional regulator
MKVLSIKEPWASMILNGKKTIETRTWKTKYRGRILLHASRKPKSEISGKIFAVAKIVDCKKMTKEDEKKACCKIYKDACSWFLEDIRPTELIEINGSLGLWNYDGEVKLKEEVFYCQNCLKEVKFGVKNCSNCGMIQLWALFG